MKSNPLRHRLMDGQPCRGMWLTLPCVPAARLLARLDFDWFCLDAEHGPMGIETMTAMVGALADAGASVLVRVAHNSVEPIKRALDAGALGIVVPMIETREQADMLVSAAKYPPVGARSHGSPWAGLPFGLAMTDYQHRANTQTLCFAQIETVRGYENVRDIATCAGLAGLFVGPVDLAISLDAAGHQTSLDTAVAEIAHVAQLYSLSAAIFCRTSQEAKQRLEQGYQMVIVATDVMVLMDGAREALEVALQ